MPLENRHEDERLESYASGMLPESEVCAVEEHLLVCAQCRERLAETEAYLRAMRHAAARARATQSRSAARFSWFRPAWAFAFAALVLVTVVLIQWRALRGPAAPAEIVLQAMRGPEAPAAPAATPLHLSLDATGLPPAASYRVEIVDETGRTAFQASAAQPGITLDAGLPAGRYFVRLYGREGLLREYVLAVRR